MFVSYTAGRNLIHFLSLQGALDGAFHGLWPASRVVIVLAVRLADATYRLSRSEGVCAGRVRFKLGRARFPSVVWQRHCHDNPLELDIRPFQ